MAANNVKHFEFRLGKWGLVLFVFGMSILVFSSFLFGVKVGKDIDAYPEKYSWGIPNKVMQALGWSGSSSGSQKTIVAVREAGKDRFPGENSEYDLSFYETLSKKSNSLTKQHPGTESADNIPPAPGALSDEKVVKVPATSPMPARKYEPEKKEVVEKRKEVEISQRKKLNLTMQGESEKKLVVYPGREKAQETKAPVAVKNVEQKSEKNIIPEKKANQGTEKVINAEKDTVKSQDKKESKKVESGVKPEVKSYLVQVGSYRDKEKADQVSNKLKSLGYTPRIVLMDIPGKGRWYRLTIGGFASHSKASEAVANVGKNIGGTKGFIRPEAEVKSESAVIKAKEKKVETQEKKNPEKKNSSDTKGKRTRKDAD